MIGRAPQSVPLQEVPELISQLGGFSVDTALGTRRLLGDTCRNCIGGRGRDLRCAAAATMYESVSSNARLPFGEGGLLEDKESIGISHVELVQNVQRWK